jgi:hypothetical protein
MARFDLSIAFNDSKPSAIAAFYEHRLKMAEAKIQALEGENQELRTRANISNPRFKPVSEVQLPQFG